MPEPAQSPHLTVLCCVPGPHWPHVVSPSYGLTTGHEVRDWFLEMMHDNEEFEVETDRLGELPLPFWSETVRWMLVG